MNANENHPGPRGAADEIIHHLGAARAQFDEVNERIEQRAGRNLFLAAGTGLGIGGILLVSLIFFKWAFLGVAAVASATAAIELATALRNVRVFVPRVGIAIAALFVIVGTVFFGLGGILGGAAIGIAFALVWYALERAIRVRRSGQPVSRQVVRDMLSIVGVVVYTGALVGFAVLVLVQDHGEWWVLGFIIVVVANDIGAYATGVAWGRHPMVPIISPKKSWEGFAGGAVAACLAGVLVSWLMLGQSWQFGLLFGVCLMLAGTAGDLLESTIKRRIGIKDMSSWLPGHGGVLDRLDSLMLSAPVAYALFVIAVH